MNLLEPLILLGILGGAIGGASVAIHGGMSPLLVVCTALVSGLAAPVTLGAVLWMVFTVESELTGRPYWPACTACGAVDFTRESLPGPTIMRCACGRRYVRHGRQCRHALPGGASRPHLLWRVFRGWTPDKDPSSTAPADLPYRGSICD